jgi:UDP-N-acetylmuramoyl-tripeptide--D-alanyl-D-alanine ligase
VSNADDPLVRFHVAPSRGRHVTFGESAGAAVRAVDVTDLGFDGTTARVVTAQGVLNLAVPLAGRAQLMNVLAAVAVALAFDVPRASIESRVSSLKPVVRRGATSRLSNGARLVDDSYNASPAAVQAMLAALAATPTAGRRIAVLGEMLELGASSHALHVTCGRAAMAAGVDELIVIGGAPADGLVEGAIAAGFAGDRLHRFADSATAAPIVADLLRPGDLVLVKGSRGTRTDIVADRLLELA